MHYDRVTDIAFGSVKFFNGRDRERALRSNDLLKSCTSNSCPPNQALVSKLLARQQPRAHPSTGPIPGNVPAQTQHGSSSRLDPVSKQRRGPSPTHPTSGQQTEYWSNREPSPSNVRNHRNETRSHRELDNLASTGVGPSSSRKFNQDRMDVVDDDTEIVSSHGAIDENSR